jgi:hypothetical protein
MYIYCIYTHVYTYIHPPTHPPTHTYSNSPSFFFFPHLSFFSSLSLPTPCPTPRLLKLPISFFSLLFIFPLIDFAHPCKTPPILQLPLFLFLVFVLVVFAYPCPTPPTPTPLLFVSLNFLATPCPLGTGAEGGPPMKFFFFAFCFTGAEGGAIYDFRGHMRQPQESVKALQVCVLGGLNQEEEKRLKRRRRRRVSLFISFPIKINHLYGDQQSHKD